MTAVDHIIPWATRFIWGFTYFSMVLGIISFGINLVTMLTVKGFEIPVWSIPIIVTIMMLFLTVFGWVCEKYNIIGRIIGHQNRNMNNEFNTMMHDIKDIKKHLGCCDA